MFPSSGTEGMLVASAATFGQLRSKVKGPSIEIVAVFGQQLIAIQQLVAHYQVW